MTSDAQKRAVAKYDASHTKQITLKLNLETDKEILKRLDEVSNKQGYIKRLIMDDVNSIDVMDRALKNNQSIICGYSYYELMIFADACRRQGIENDDLLSFARNAESAYQYILDSMSEAFDKQLETGN